MFTFDTQTAFEQVTQRLDGLQTSQNQMLQVLIQTVDIQTNMLATQNQMLRDSKQLQSDVKQLNTSHLQLLKVQNQMLDYMKFTFDQEAKWNERQDQSNIILLDKLREVKSEVREIKSDVREIKKKVFGEMESRLIKSEDFMNDQLRKAS